jgi:hypothetical protein
VLLTEQQYLPPPQVSSSEAEERVQWARDMRRLLSPPDMLLADGSVNQEFFKPKKVPAMVACMMCVCVAESSC